LKFISLILKEHHRNLFEKEYIERRNRELEEKVRASSELSESEISVILEKEQKRTFKDIFSFDNLRDTMSKEDGALSLQSVKRDVDITKEELEMYQRSVDSRLEKS
jgi:hypothetical protein